MAGPSYTAISPAPTISNLHSLASSQTHLAGWFSAAYDNQSLNYLDYVLSGEFKTAGSARQAGYINIYVVPVIVTAGTPTWPDVSSGSLGTEQTNSFISAEQRDSSCSLLASVKVNNAVNTIFPLKQTSMVNRLGLIMPPSEFCFFITQDAATTTSAGLAASGTILDLVGVVSP